MTRRVAKFGREMAQVVGAIGGPPRDAPGVPDMVEVEPGIWVRAPRATNPHTTIERQPAPLLEAVATAFGVDLADHDDLEDLKGIAEAFGIDLEDELGGIGKFRRRPWKG